MLSHPEQLTADHDVEAFSSGNVALDDWLRMRALANQEKGFAAVMVVHEAGRVVGYYASTPTVVLPSQEPHPIRGRQASGRDASGRMPQKPGPQNPVPCLLLGHLATDTIWSGQGISTSLLTHALQRCVLGARLTGAPAVVVRAPDDAAEAFWKRRGFLPSKDDPFVLFRSIPDIAASLQAAGMALAC